jgi:DNA-binding transcriptional LysR family regulator
MDLSFRLIQIAKHSLVNSSTTFSIRYFLPSYVRSSTKSEDQTWFGSSDHTRHLQTAIPIVLAPSPCIYRNRVLHALNKRKRSCQIVYISSSYNGISAALQVGIGITAMAGSPTPSGSRILSESDELPSLAQLELHLHSGSGKIFEALRRLEDYIEGIFSNKTPPRTNN